MSFDASWAFWSFSWIVLCGIVARAEGNLTHAQMQRRGVDGFSFWSHLAVWLGGGFFLPWAFGFMGGHWDEWGSGAKVAALVVGILAAGISSYNWAQGEKPDHIVAAKGKLSIAVWMNFAYMTVLVQLAALYFFPGHTRAPFFEKLLVAAALCVFMVAGTLLLNKIRLGHVREMDRQACFWGVSGVGALFLIDSVVSALKY